MATVVLDRFGSVDGVQVDQFKLISDSGVSMHVLSYGGIVQRLDVPDCNGNLANVVLGFSTIDEYVRFNGGPYFGCITGRFANRISGAAFELDGVRYPLPANNGPNCLHGGVRGFNAHNWSPELVDGDGGVGVALSRVSPAGEEGFPGALTTTVTYLIDDVGNVTIDYRATTDAPTVINLTNHTYFNLAGEGSGSILDHELQLLCSRYTPTDELAIPTGDTADVRGTPFDFLESHVVGERITSDHEQVRIGQGYDHNYVVDRSGPGLAPVANLRDPASGRTLRVETTEPGVQVYSGNFLDGTLTGVSGVPYQRNAGLALETQHFPDSPNQPSFPSTVLRQGETFSSTTTWSFATSLE